ncbi:unnamed protein product [Allacma fusca]|uniref:Uncharacterized protein n=1 Tax=Allacma fusca TaxID=39272 RepID=A0A8J2KHQ3_9HEXA|nr:unnamed protein product [Allacma fusca]
MQLLRNEYKDRKRKKRVKPSNGLYDDLKGKASPLYLILDCETYKVQHLEMSADLNDDIQNAIQAHLNGIQIPNMENMHGVSTYQKFPGGYVSSSTYVSGTPSFKPEITGEKLKIRPLLQVKYEEESHILGGMSPRLTPRLTNLFTVESFDRKSWTGRHAPFILADGKHELTSRAVKCLRCI